MHDAGESHTENNGLH
jgi:hypothetical protein